MWLLKTDVAYGDSNLELKQVWGNIVEPYAILSHRWSSIPDEEVSFADVRYLARAHHDNDSDRQAILDKPGYLKLIAAMQKAYADGWQYIWIDTCCIDKDSSVELSEAINSMYRYYAQAQICYAYLGDVDDVVNIHKSIYFKRGWTLQELLAPTNLVFTDKYWNNIGTKQSLSRAVSKCTRIGEDYLLGQTPITHACIAERMSWAAERQLSREEDVAYSLLGIFQVNMYQLYGEGKQRAFQRLQEEILKQTEDQTIFAWRKSSGSTTQRPTAETIFDREQYHGLLADGPEDFKNGGSTRVYAGTPELAPPVMTARGLHCSLPLTPKSERLMVASLHCQSSDNNDGFFGLYLLQLGDKPNSYVRVCCDLGVSSEEPGQVRAIYVVQNFEHTPRDVIYPYHRLRIKQVRGSMNDLSVQSLFLSHNVKWPRESAQGQKTFKINKQPGTQSALISIRYTGSSHLLSRSFDITFASTTGGALTWFFPDSETETMLWQPPRPSGCTVVLPLVDVTIWIEEQVVSDTKWFSATIHVKIKDEEHYESEEGKDDLRKTAKNTLRKGREAWFSGMKKLIPGRDDAGNGSVSAHTKAHE